jgi:hypothetical protein
MASSVRHNIQSARAAGQSSTERGLKMQEARIVYPRTYFQQQLMLSGLLSHKQHAHFLATKHYIPNEVGWS